MALPSTGSEDGQGSVESRRGVDGYGRDCGGGDHKREVKKEQRGTSVEKKKHSDV